MPRELSQDAMQALLAEQTDKVFLDCLTIEHASFGGEPIRLVNDRQDLTRSAGIYRAFPFQVEPYQDGDESMPEVKITADVVDRRIIQALRALPVDDPPTITLETVLAHQPNTVEYGPLPMTVESVAANSASVIELTVGFRRQFLTEPFPAGRMTPSRASDGN